MSSLIKTLIDSGSLTLYHDYRSGTYQDFSGNAYHGTPTNCVLTGKGLQQTYLTSGYVTVADCTLFDSNKYGTIFVLVDQQDTQADTKFRSLFNYTTDAGGTLVAEFFPLSGSTTAYYMIGESSTQGNTASIDIRLSRSHAYVFENGTLSDCYSNGYLHDDLSANLTLTNLAGNGDLVIGNRASRYNNSIIQAVVVCKTKLTASQIAQLHNELLSKKWPSKVITNTSVNSLIDTSSSGLVSAYDFRNGSLLDIKGTNHGTQTGSLDFVKTRFGTFVRGDEQGSINLGSSFSAQTNFFVSMWIDYQLPTISSWIINQYNTTASAFGLYNSSVSGLCIYDDISNANTTRYNTLLVVGNRYHVVYGINSSNLCKMWINGVPADNDEYAAASFSTIGGNLYLLSRINSAYSNSSIGNVEVYNTDLTDSDVTAIYNRGKRIISKFENGIIASGNIITDSYLENTPFYTSSIGNWQVVYNSTYNSKNIKCNLKNRYIYMPSSKFSINPNQAAYGTWQFTAKKVGIDEPLKVGFIASSDSTPKYTLQIQNDGTIVLVEVGIVVLATSSTAVSLNEFHKFRITRDYTGKFTVWVDDILMPVSSGNNPVTDNTTQESCCITLNCAANDELILVSQNPEYSFWYSPMVIEP